jgi:anthranilate synthase component 1
MYVPDPDTFAALARPGAMVAVYREILADLETPVSAYMKLANGAEHAFLLESVEGGEALAHYSFVGANPYAVATFDQSGGSVRWAAGSVEPLASPDPLDFVEQHCSRELRGDLRELPRFIGGAVGYIGYECARLWEPTIPLPTTDTLGLPSAVLMMCDTLLVFDHVRHRALVLALAYIDEDTDAHVAYADATTRIDAVVECLAAPLPEDAIAPADTTGIALSGGVVAPTESNTTYDQYCASVDTTKAHIERGNIIQAVVSQRWSRPTDVPAFRIYRSLRMVNPSPYMYFLKLDDLSIVGASPELLVQVHDGHVATHPIAGTRPRGDSAETDLAFENELRADPKEQSEHVMLVDLGRNDIGRVARPGTVHVDTLMEVERYSHVMHLCSHVSGDLRDDVRPTDALRACFPAGTVSGAPKIRAMQVIADLEPDQRGPYAGAVGYFGFDGNLDTAITIRTLLVKDGVATVQAGAGIVADSVPHAEYEETRNKARAMLRAIDVAEQLTFSFGVEATPS